MLPTARNGSAAQCLNSPVRSLSGVEPVAGEASSSRSVLHNSTRRLFWSCGARNCCSSLSTSARDSIDGDLTNARIAGSFATVAVLVEIVFADCWRSDDSCCVKFCKRSRPTSNAVDFTARYEAQLQATRMRASSVPIKSGRRYLKETFASDHLPCFMRHLSHPCSQPGGMPDGKTISRTAGQPKWESC